MTFVASFAACAVILMGFAPSAAEAAPEIELAFNTPGLAGHAATTTVEDRFIETIRKAAPGSMLRGSIFTFSRRNVAEELVLASERGVDVQLVLDGSDEKQKHQPGSAMDVLLRGFDDHPGIKCSDRPCIKFCHGPFQFLGIGHGQIGGSCHGLVINHNKFMIFSELTDGSKNVVLQSSHNLDENMLHRYNDIVEVRGDRKLFEGYLHYWKGLRRDRTRFTSPGDFVGDSGIIVYTSPRFFGSDPVLDLLRRVRCNLPNSYIRAAESDLGRVGVARRLKQLRDAGCEVQILAASDHQLRQPGWRTRRALRGALAMLNDESREGINSIHTKIMLIDAALDGTNKRELIVLTGSQNLDEFSLRMNDECQMEIHDAAVYSQYLGFWYQMLEDANVAGYRTFGKNYVLLQ